MLEWILEILKTTAKYIVTIFFFILLFIAVSFSLEIPGSLLSKIVSSSIFKGILYSFLAIFSLVIIGKLAYETAHSIKENPITFLRTTLSFIALPSSFAFFLYILPFIILKDRLPNPDIPVAANWILLILYISLTWKISFKIFEKIHPSPHSTGQK